MSHIKILKNIKTGNYQTMDSNCFYQEFGSEAIEPDPDHVNWITIDTMSNREAHKVDKYIKAYEKKQRGIK